MGVYGYGTAGIKIPEGYLRVKIETDDGDQIEQEILYPVNPGSVYHMTKTQDQLLFAFYNKNDAVRVTDLHQGIVWGTQTDRDPTRRATHQPLRLRRRLRHRTQPLPDAGRGRLSADGPRHRRPDARVHPHPGHGALHPAGDREPAGARRARPGLQPDDRDAPRARAGDAGREPHRRRDRLRRQPAQGGRRERSVRQEQPSARPRPAADHARRTTC